MTRRAEYMASQSRDSATFDNTYQTLGSALSSPAILVKIVNDSAIDVDISTDGTTDHDFVPANGFVLYDLRANHGQEIDFAFPQGTQFYVKGSVVSTGLVYLVSMRERP